MRRPMVTTICIWVMSLVVRVMRLAVEKWSNSWLVKRETFENTSPRRVRAAPAPTREASRPTRMLDTAPTSETSSILPPVFIT